MVKFHKVFKDWQISSNSIWYDIDAGAEYIKQFPFTGKQFKAFSQTVADCGFTEMNAVLLEEKQSRVVVEEKMY